MFGNIPKGQDEDGNHIPGFAAVIGDRGDITFDGLIVDSYGSADSFERLYRFLNEEFPPRCEWGPMYLKVPKCHFFDCSLELVGLEAGDNGIRPSLRKRKMISEWLRPTSWEEVRAFCYLTPFLRRFIPGRAELVKIMKKGMEVEMNEENKDSERKGETPGRKEPEVKEDKESKRGTRRAVSKPRKMEGPFVWTDAHESTFQSIKHAIVTNAMAMPDPDKQSHLAVDASKKGIGGALFQFDGISSHTEATNSAVHQDAERIVMFISFKLEDAETRYSNSEREALVIRCLAEVCWMVISSPYPTLVYTDHEVLRVLLTRLDNDAHGQIAKWQECLGGYDFRLLH